MQQAQALTERDIKETLAHVSPSSYPAHNRSLFQRMLYSGMRVSEIAAANKGDVIHAEGRVRELIQLKPH